MAFSLPPYVVARILRSELQTGFFHITNRGAGRQVVFRTDADRVDFVNLLGAGHERFAVSVLAYCLMGNHFHLVVACPQPGLSQFMQLVGGQYTRHANERSGSDGPIFRGRFFSRSVLSERYLLNAVRYVHRNPLDLCPGRRLDTFRWSSHRSYLGLGQRPGWLSCSPVLDWFGSVEAYRAFVDSDVGQVAVDDCSGPELWDALLHAAEEVAGDLDRSARGLARTLAYLVMDRVTERCRSELMVLLGSASPDAIQQASRRARRQATISPVLDSAAHRALELVANVHVVSDTT